MKDQASATKNYYSHNFVRKCGHVSCSLGKTSFYCPQMNPNPIPIEILPVSGIPKFGIAKASA